MSFWQTTLIKSRVLLGLSVLLSLCFVGSPSYAQKIERSEETMMEIQVGDVTLQAEFASTKAAEALKQQLVLGEIKVKVSPYGGFEVVGELPTDLPQSDQRLTAISGDIMLYQGSYIVLFFGSNTWAYTRLAHIDGYSQEQLGKILGQAKDITLKLK